MALAGSGLHGLHSRKVTTDRWLFEIDVLFYLESLLCDVFEVDCTSGFRLWWRFPSNAGDWVGKLEDIIAEQPSAGHIANLCAFEFQRLQFKAASSSNLRPPCLGPKAVYRQPARFVSRSRKAWDLNRQGIDGQSQSSTRVCLRKWRSRIECRGIEKVQTSLQSAISHQQVP
jgi:hypothetical protein